MLCVGLMLLLTGQSGNAVAHKFEHGLDLDHARQGAIIAVQAPSLAMAHHADPGDDTAPDDVPTAHEHPDTPAAIDVFVGTPTNPSLVALVVLEDVRPAPLCGLGCGAPDQPPKI